MHIKQHTCVMLTSLPCLSTAYGVIQVKGTGGQQNRWWVSKQMPRLGWIKASGLVVNLAGPCSVNGKAWDGMSQFHKKKKNPLDFDWDCNKEVINLRIIYDYLILSLLSLDIRIIFSWDILYICFLWFTHWDIAVFIYLWLRFCYFFLISYCCCVFLNFYC